MIGNQSCRVDPRQYIGLFHAKYRLWYQITVLSSLYQLVFMLYTGYWMRESMQTSMLYHSMICAFQMFASRFPSALFASRSEIELT